MSAVAKVVLTENELRIKMSRLERLGALHVDVVVPRSSVTFAQVAPDGLRVVRGLRAPGTGIPGYLMLGTTRGSFGRDFCVVRGRGPAVVIDLSAQPFERLVVSASDAPSVVAALRSKP